MDKEYTLEVAVNYPAPRVFKMDCRYFNEAKNAATLALFVSGSTMEIEWPWRIDKEFVFESRRLSITITRR